MVAPEDQRSVVLTTAPPADDGRRVLVARGLLDAVGGELLECAVELLSLSAQHVVVDLSDCLIEPAGWAGLAAAAGSCRASGTRLDLCNVAPNSAEPTVPSSSKPSSPGDRAGIRCYPDGPLLCRGDFELVGRDGQPIPRRRNVVALCRCGASAIKPFCDGSHKVTGFSDES